MKIVFAQLFLLTGLMNITCIISAMKSKKNDSIQAIIALLVVSFMIIAEYSLTLWCNMEIVMRLGYCIYFATMSWLCFKLFDFVLAFAGIRRIRSKIYMIVKMVVIIDSTSQILNFFFKHSVEFTTIKKGKELYLELIPKLPFQLHLIICYILISGVFIFLIYESVISSRIYRTQYISVFMCTLIIVLVNAVFLTTNLNIDVSILGYGLSVSVLYYYLSKQMPRRMIQMLSGVIFDSMPSAITLFNNNGEIIYKNKETENQMQKGEDLEEICAYYHICIQAKDKNFQEEIELNENGKARILNITYHPMTEKTIFKKDVPVGGYINVEDITEELESLKQREYKATHSTLTGLYNKQYFYEAARVIIKQNPHITYAIVLTDIVDFKFYNEMFGIQKGDHLLKAQAVKLQYLVKDERVLYAHYDGDHFCLCMPVELCTKEYFDTICLTQPIQSELMELRTCAGISVIDDVNATISTHCERASIAIQRIKKDIHTRFSFFDETIRNAVMRENHLSAILSDAITHKEIQLYIQPQIDQMNNTLVGGEVLARWIKPDGTMISPGEFIPIFEKNGQVTVLDMFIWENACQFLSQMQLKGAIIPLSVNISAQDFYHCDIYDVFTKLVEKYKLAPKYLTIEITESQMLNNLEEQIKILERLQVYGFRIEMDDFGSGYSALNSLKDIPVNVLKIDLRFLEAAKDMDKSRKILKHIAALAGDLGMQTISEGVETKEQVDFLKSINCRYIQGFYYSKPLSLENFISFSEKYEWSEMN